MGFYSPDQALAYNLQCEVDSLQLKITHLRAALEKIEKNSRLDGGNPSLDGEIARRALNTEQ